MGDMDGSGAVASIDIGAAYTRCALVRNGQEKSDTFSILQFPTSLLISPDGEFDSFGEKANEKYLELLKTGKQTEWFHFKAFKSHLYGRKTDKNSELKDVNARGFSAVSIFKMTIEFAVNQIKEHFEKQNISSVVRWAITVPAVWRQQSKHLALQAALMVGLPLEQTVITLDTEAAAVYCHREMDIEGGTNFVVFDVGDCRMDVGAFSVKNDGTLEELDAFQDQHLKFSSVGDNLVGLVVDLLSKTVLEKLRTTKPDEFHKFISQFTRKSVENDENEWSFAIPQSVLDIFKGNFKKSLKENMKGYRNGNVTLSDNCLILNKEVIRELCEVTATSIEKNISESLKDSRYQAIKNVYLVGGQSKYSIYSSIFEKSFPEKKFLIPGDSHLAVVKGSVMYAQNELCILKRRLKYTYGVLQSPVFKLGQHDEKHACIDDDGVKRCLDCFVSLAIKGQVIGANEAVTKTFRPQGSLVGTTQLANIYQSTNRSPKYTSDPDCEYLGSASVLMLDKSVASNKDMEVKMWFGKPLVTMEATDNATNKVYKNVFHCLNEKNI